MRALILITGAALAVSACGGGGDDSANTDLAVNNMIVDDSATANAMLEGDMNAMGDLNAMGDMNAMDPSTQNAMQQDLSTNDADTNLANGL